MMFNPRSSSKSPVKGLRPRRTPKIFAVKNLMPLPVAALIAIGVSATVVVVVYAQNPAVAVTIDAAASRHSINPNVYGLAYPSSSALTDLNVPVQRYGGNNTSR